MLYTYYHLFSPETINIFSKYTAAATTFLAVAFAAPSISPSQPQQKYYALDQLARFETAPGLPGLAIAPINLYLDIFWNGMSLVETINPLITGVVANSPLSYAAFSTLDIATVQQSQPAMTVNYADSTVDHFDLKSFYYDCALGSEASVAGVPLPCTIMVRGYSDNDGEELVATQNFDYKVGLLQLQSQMQKAVLGNGFKGVKKVEFDVSDELITAGLIDTVSYTVYSTEKIGN